MHIKFFSLMVGIGFTVAQCYAQENGAAPSTNQPISQTTILTNDELMAQFYAKQAELAQLSEKIANYREQWVDGLSKRDYWRDKFKANRREEYLKNTANKNASEKSIDVALEAEWKYLQEKAWEEYLATGTVTSLDIRGDALDIEFSQFYFAKLYNDMLMTSVLMMEWKKLLGKIAAIRKQSEALEKKTGAVN